MSVPGAHVLVFPYPAQGHMIPLLDFTHRLAARGLTVTVLVTPKNLNHLAPLLSAHPNSVAPLVLPFPPHPSIPAGVENTVDLPDGGFRLMISALSDLRGPLAEWLRRHPSPPVAIVSDMFLGWTRHLGIPRYAFFPSGAFAVSFIYSLWRDMPERRDPRDDNELVGTTDVPDSPFYPWWQLSPLFRSYVKGDPNSEFLRYSLLDNFASRGLVFNTFDALEGIYLSFLKKKLGHGRIWSIGPLLPTGPAERGGSSPASDHEIFSWLDTCHNQTVVYVCFGSQAVLTNTQMTELTSGLEKSEVKFILSYKGATEGHNGDYGSIPPGFEDRVKGRGLVIKGWAPQVPILRHKAVCAFFTHCGWNSTLESIVAGVPMLAWPMTADQFLDATLLVEKLDVAIRVCEGGETVPDSKDLVQFLKETKGPKWSEKRARAEALSKAALEAVSGGGSTYKNWDDIARDFSGNCAM